MGEIRSSPAKVDEYIAAARKEGDKPALPPSFCQSRWLDRYKASTDVIEHFDTLEYYYKHAKTPRKKVEWKDTAREYTDSDSYSDSDSDDDEETKLDKQLQEAKKMTAKFRKNPYERVVYQKKMFGEQKVHTELEFIVCQDGLKDGYDFLRIFQSKEIKIHLLYEAFNSLIRKTLISVCEITGIRTTTTKRLLTGAELKNLVLETQSERDRRREKERFQRGRSKSEEYERHCLILEADQV